jgi:hypothetical protein
MDTSRNPLLRKPTQQELQEMLAELLVNGSFYKRLCYDGELAHILHERQFQRIRGVLLPTQIKMYCEDEKCYQETIWQAYDPQLYLTQDPFHRAKYTAVTVGRTRRSIGYAGPKTRPTHRAS